MNFQEYKEMRANGLVCAGIEDSVALRLGSYLPKQCQLAVAFWNIFAVLVVLVAILIAVFIKWWVGILILFFVPTIIRANKKSAIGFVLDYVEEDEDFFNMLNQKGLLVFRDVRSEV